MAICLDDSTMEEHVEHLLWFTGALLCAGLQDHVAEEMTSINTMVPIIFVVP